MSFVQKRAVRASCFFLAAASSSLWQAKRYVFSWDISHRVISKQKLADPLRRSANALERQANRPASVWLLPLPHTRWPHRGCDDFRSLRERAAYAQQIWGNGRKPHGLFKTHSKEHPFTPPNFWLPDNVACFLLAAAASCAISCSTSVAGRSWICDGRSSSVESGRNYLGCIKMPTGSWGCMLATCRSYVATRILMGPMGPSLGMCLSNQRACWNSFGLATYVSWRSYGAYGPKWGRMTATYRLFGASLGLYVGNLQVLWGLFDVVWSCWNVWGCRLATYGPRALMGAACRQPTGLLERVWGNWNQFGSYT